MPHLCFLVGGRSESRPAFPVVGARAHHVSQWHKPADPVLSETAVSDDHGLVGKHRACVLL